MNKKTAYVTFIIACLLSLSMVFKPQHINKVSGANGDLVFYGLISPDGDVYQDDDYLFGGTIFNNLSDDTFRVTQLRVDFEYTNTSGMIETTRVSSEQFADEDPRYWVAPFEAKTVYFQTVMNLTIGRSYNLSVKILFINIESGVETPFTRQIGENATISVQYKRPPSPSYIWAVLILLSVGILAFVVLGIVGWVKDRRAKK
ncbi:MAG: hypothetical protein ACTSQK_04870 [Candidatus Heimdallarchaeota archaeon]